MEVTYLDAVMAFFGLASIVIGSFADRLTGETLRARQAASTERQICQLRRQLRQQPEQAKAGEI